MNQRTETKTGLTSAGWPSSRSASFLALLVVFSVALVLRLAAVALMAANYSLTTYSESGIIAANLVGGQGYSFDYFGLRPDGSPSSFVPPLYTWLLMLCLRFTPNPNMALGGVQAVLSSLTVLLVFFIGSRLSGRPGVGLAAAIGVAVYPVFVVMCAFPISLTLNIFLLACVLALAVKLRERPSLPAAAVTGLVLGASLLARPMWIGLLPIVAIWLWLGWPGQRAAVLRAGGVMALAAVVVILPWTIRNYRVHGELVFISTNSGYVFWSGVPQKEGRSIPAGYSPSPLPAELVGRIDALNEAEVDKALYGAGLRAIQQEPGTWLSLVAARLAGFWWLRQGAGVAYEASWLAYYKLLFAALLLVAVPGLIISLRKPRAYALLYMLFACYMAVYVTSNVNMRYRWEIEPYFILFAALTAVTALEAYKSSRRARHDTTEVTSEPTAIG